MVLLTTAVALIASDVRLEGTASARVETRARTAVGSDVPGAAAAGDVEVDPILTGALEDRGSRFQLLYSPVIRMREPYSDTTRRTEFNHQQTFNAEYRREGYARPYLTESFYYGLVDLGIAQNSPAFEVGQVRQLSLDVNGGVAWPIGRLTTLDTSAGYFYGAGADAVSIKYLPAERAYRTRLNLETQVTKVDTLSGAFDSTFAEFPGLESRFGTASLAARYKRQLVVSTAIVAGVLGAGVLSSQNAQVPTWAAMPGGDLTLQTRVNSGAHVLAFDLGARVAPFIDRYLATAYDRGELFTTIGYVFQERWEFTGRGGVARSLTPVHLQDDVNPEEILTTFVEARLGYAAPRYWRVDLSGVNSTFVLTNAAPVNNWLVSLSLTLHAEGRM